MDEEDTKKGIEQDKRAIDNAVDKVRREANTALKNIEVATLEIGDALLYKLEEDDKVKSAMVINAATIVKKEDELVKNIVKLTGILSKFVKNVYDVTDELNVIPESFVLLGRHWKYHSSVVSQSATATDRVATLSGYNKSDSKPMIRSCCELIITACMLERHALTKNPWIIEPNTDSSGHPDGMIGHVYDVLWAYDTKTPRTEHAPKFREEFESRVNNHLIEADALEEEANNLVACREIPEEGHAQKAVEYLECAIGLLKDVLKLVEDASKHIERLEHKAVACSTFRILEDNVVELCIRVDTKTVSSKIYDIEILTQIQEPFWRGVEGTAAPEGWGFEEMDNGVKCYTETNPLLKDQEVTFKFKVLVEEFSNEIRLHATDIDHKYFGPIISKRQ